MKVFSDPSVAGYASPGHPEAPWRVTRTAERLRAAGLAPELPPLRAGVDDVKLAHTERHWRSVQTGEYEDADTPHFKGIHELALTSLSGALSALEASKREPAFSLMRPPGHHAAAERVAGFCYVNNVAVACLKTLAEGKRVATLDVDVHHGDGTEAIALGKDGWLFVSLHQSPLYPGTGLASRDNCVNFPLEPFTGEGPYLKALEKALERVLAFKPDVLAVSAGFDTYKECPIANLRLEKPTYRRIGAMIAETKLRRFAALEGGYAEALPELVEGFLSGFDG